MWVFQFAMKVFLWFSVKGLDTKVWILSFFNEVAFILWFCFFSYYIVLRSSDFSFMGINNVYLRHVHFFVFFNFSKVLQVLVMYLNLRVYLFVFIFIRCVFSWNIKQLRLGKIYFKEIKLCNKLTWSTCH